jgi:hypothetical protein
MFAASVKFETNRTTGSVIYFLGGALDDTVKTFTAVLVYQLLILDYRRPIDLSAEFNGSAASIRADGDINRVSDSSARAFVRSESSG